MRWTLLGGVACAIAGGWGTDSCGWRPPPPHVHYTSSQTLVLSATVGRRCSPVCCMAAEDELWTSLRKRLDEDEQSATGVLTDEEQGSSNFGSIRPASIRLEGLDGAGLRYAEASLASTTGPVFNADDLPEGEVLTPSRAIKGLYAAFNARDAACVASFLTEECVYEDLLLGPATVCRGKRAFLNALRFHPAFVTSRLFSGLPFADLLPDLTLEVDSIAEGVDTVGVEWHVQCGDSAFPLGRGLSQAQVCTRTGKIKRVVDIAEAPWRVIGLLALPVINSVQALMALLSTNSSAAQHNAGDEGARIAGMDASAFDSSSPDTAESENELGSAANAAKACALTH